MTDTDIVVIGGGAAGMMAAAKAAAEGCTVTLLEKNAFCGKKINITGKGRCNMTNMKPWAEFSQHVHPVAAFLRPAFYSFSNEDTVDFFNSIGVPTVVTQGDRVFPESMRAFDVSRALASHLEDIGVNVICGADVLGVTKSGEDAADGNAMRTSFIVDGRAEAEVIASAAVIVATGGLSYPTTGSTGFGYEIAKSFGHSITTTFPSLTALMPSHYDRDLEGLELQNVGIILYVDRDLIQMEQGDLNFTDNGIEGPIGFRISRKAVHALINGQKVELSLDLKPALSLEKLNARIDREIASLGSSRATLGPAKMRSLLRTLMPAELVAPFVNSHPELNASNLAGLLKEWRFKISSYTGYERAVVTAGGVNQKEIIAKSMRSRKEDGLYFAGEVIDMDCDTGGYNLQAAFSTGALAGRSAAQRILNSRSGESE